MQLGCLIFDLDGTLWDAIDCCVNAWNSVLSEERYHKVGKVCRSDFLASMGKNHSEIREIYFTSLPLQEREGLLRECYSREIPNIYKTPPALYPGVAAGLVKLREKYRMAIVSNCQRKYLEAFIDLFGFQDIFEKAVCFEDTGRPKGENVVSVLNDVPVHMAAYIGDTMGDQNAAEYAKIPFYFAEYGFGQSDKHAKSFKNFYALTNHFLSLQ